MASFATDADRVQAGILVDPPSGVTQDGDVAAQAVGIGGPVSFREGQMAQLALAGVAGSNCCEAFRSWSIWRSVRTTHRISLGSRQLSPVGCASFKVRVHYFGLFAWIGVGSVGSVRFQFSQVLIVGGEHLGARRCRELA